VPTIAQLSVTRVPQRCGITARIISYVRFVVGKGYRHILNLHLVSHPTDR
jgi:hypothetical protein